MNIRIPVISLVLVMTLFAAACSGPSVPTTAPIPPVVTDAALPANPTSVPTALPQLSTAVAATGTALASNPVATMTAAPATAVSAAPVATAAVTAGPTAAVEQPTMAEVVLLLIPGPNSKVASPVQVSGMADPTFEQNLVIQIMGADGKVLATQPATIQSASSARGAFSAQVAFTVKDQQPGRIAVFSTSARDGGLVHLSSVEVTLLGNGPAALVTGQTHNEAHMILEPAPQTQMSGGTLHFSGFSDYVFESQLSVALCGEGGSGAPDPVCGTADNVLAGATVNLNAPDVGQPGPFAGMLAYHVSATVPARLVIYSRSARDGGVLHLSSVPVTLAP